MKWLNGYRMRLMLVGFVAAVVLSSGSAKADFIFGEPVNLGPTVNSSMQDGGASLSADGLSLFYDSRPGGEGWGICVSTRETLDDDWGEHMNLGPAVNQPVNAPSLCEWDPSISADGLELFFSRGYLMGTRHDLFVTTRETTDGEWCTAVSLGETVNSSDEDIVDNCPCISADGLSLYFNSDRAGGQGGNDLYVTTRPSRNDAWSAPVNLGPTINSSSADIAPSITSDGLTLIFSSKRPGKYSNPWDLWITRRRTTSDPWGEPINLGPFINTDDVDYADISPDGTTLYLTCWNRSRGYGLYDIWQASIIPVVDFNGDAIVDVKDVAILTDHWGENYPLCDIGPMPLGDGIVDVQDLIVLTEYIEPIDHTLIAHWALDELEGDFAEDSAVGDDDAVVIGGPAWQPDGGKVGGALQFDGIDDYVSTPFVLNPGDVSFSVFVWIKSSASGQFIISQADSPEDPTYGPGSNWLGTDQSSGRLISGLMGAYFGPLESDFVVTDDQWHHVGLVYDRDSMHRHLYVDGVEVAADTDTVPVFRCDGSLYIGAGKDLEPESFYSGLIDDVRIYNRVVSP
ncbi:MAG: LamG-like jellyroll fold domain-containing protein [Sedimentisphaerales bacterium]